MTSLSNSSEQLSSNSTNNWWNFAQSAWNTVKETATEFQEAISNENQETIARVKSSIDEKHITNKLSSATTSINNFFNTTLLSIHENVTAYTNNTTTTKITNESFPTKPFEKERGTYVNNPYDMKQHKLKYTDFIKNELKLSDKELCIKGQKLLKCNAVIASFYASLVSNGEIEEHIFWKRYFYWQFKYELREKRIHRHCNRNDSNIDNEENENKEGNISSNVSNTNSNSLNVKIIDHKKDTDLNVEAIDDSDNEIENEIELGCNMILDDHSSDSNVKCEILSNESNEPNESLTESDTQLSSTQAMNVAVDESSAERFSETSWMELQPGATVGVVVSAVVSSSIVKENLNGKLNEENENNKNINNVIVGKLKEVIVDDIVINQSVSNVIKDVIDDIDNERSDIDWDTWN